MNSYYYCMESKIRHICYLYWMLKAIWVGHIIKLYPRGSKNGFATTANIYSDISFEDRQNGVMGL